jgi:hypothetical protein
MRTYRIQIDVPEDRYQEIERLMEECGFTTKKEFFDNAVTLIKWAVNKARNGLLIASIDEKSNKYTELQMPFLEKVQEKKSRGHAAE